MTVLIGIAIYMAVGMAFTLVSWWLASKTCDYLGDK